MIYLLRFTADPVDAVNVSERLRVVIEDLGGAVESAGYGPGGVREIYFTGNAHIGVWEDELLAVCETGPWVIKDFELTLEA